MTAITSPAPTRRGRGLIDLLRRHPDAIPALLVLTLVLAWAIAPGLFTGQDPVAGVAGRQLLSPSLAHPLGTDGLGRDLLARVIYGARESLLGAAVAVAVGLSLGTLLGIVAGARGGWLDAVVMRLVDTLLAIPALLLSLSVIILLGFGTIKAAIAVGFVSVAHFARLSRAEVLRVRHSEYVEAAFGSGGRFAAVLWRHVLPNATTSVLALASLQFGSAILALSTLGFLGYGAPPPTPEWGLLIAEGRDFLARAWWLTTAPGLVVVAVVVATERLSRILGEIER